MACSSGNTQPWEFVVVTDPAIRRRDPGARWSRRSQVIDQERAQTKAQLTRRRRALGDGAGGGRESPQGAGDRRRLLESGARHPHEGRVRRESRRLAARDAGDPGRARRQPLPGLAEHDARGPRPRPLVALHDLLLPAPRADPRDPRHPAADLHGVRDVPRLRRRRSSVRRGGCPSRRSATRIAGARRYCPTPVESARRRARNGSRSRTPDAARSAASSRASTCESRSPIPRFDGLYRALLEHHVLFFRKQALAPDEQVALAKRFGAIDIHPFGRHLEGRIPRSACSTRPSRSATARTAGTRTRPSCGSRRSWRSCTPSRFRRCGGDTSWASMIAAWELLSPALKRCLEGRRRGPRHHGPAAPRDRRRAQRGRRSARCAPPGPTNSIPSSAAIPRPAGNSST